jgi:hypothetical protein
VGSYFIGGGRLGRGALVGQLPSPLRKPCVSRRDDIITPCPWFVNPYQIDGDRKMGKNEKTSGGIASIASKGLKHPEALTKTEIKRLSGSVLTQAPDKGKK